MSNNNNNNSDYDSSRLVFAPVKKEPGTTGPTRLASLRTPSQFGPPTNSTTMVDSSSTRRFAPKISASASSHRRRIVSSTMSSDINDDMKDHSAGEGRGFSGRGRDSDRGRGAPRGRRVMNNIIHMGSALERDQKILEEDPMVIDSSSDEESKVGIIREKSPEEMQAEYLEGIPNPPLKLLELKGDQKDEKLFGPSSSLKEDNLFFVQLPSHLPMIGAEKKINKKQQSVDDEYEDTWNKEFENSLMDLPEGQLGTLKVYKSGKTKLELKSKNGKSILLDVLPSQDHSFCEDIASIDIDAKRFFMLGSISKRLTCIPDCETLLGFNDVGSSSDDEE